MKNTTTVFIIISLLLFSNNISAEVIKGGRPLGMAGAFVTEEDINALYYNAAGLSEINQIHVVFTYMPLYDVDNLFHFKIAGVIPYKYLRIGLSYYNLSLTDAYTQNEIILGCGWKTTDFLSIGMNFKYYFFSVDLAENETSFDSQISFLSMDAGLILHFIKWMRFGISAKNLTNPRIRFSDDSSNYASERVFTTGIKVDFTDYFHVALDEEFKKNKSIVLRFGSELWFYNVIAVRAGISKNDMYSIGIGLKMKYGNIDFGLQAHPYLGNQYIVDLTGKF